MHDRNVGTALLRDVCQLVRQQPAAVVRMRRVGAVAEGDVGSDGVGAGAEGSRGRVGVAAGVRAHGPEVASEARLEIRPQRR